MSLPKVILGDDFAEWRIYAIKSTMRSPTFLMDDAGMACQVILDAVDNNLKDFQLYIRLLNNTSSATLRKFGRTSGMSLPTAVQSRDFVEWRIFKIESKMRSPTFRMDDAGMSCQVILEEVNKTAKEFKLRIHLSNNTEESAIFFICHINDDYHVKVENNRHHHSGEYNANYTVSAQLSPNHTCNGKRYMYVKLRWFIFNEWTSHIPILPSTLPGKFSWLLNSGEFSDVAIETKDRSRIPVHQNILAMHSLVFHAMLNCDMVESKSRCIKITDFPPETVKQMVTFIYSGQLEDVTNESATSLWKIADKYDLKDLKQFCAMHPTSGRRMHCSF